MRRAGACGTAAERDSYAAVRDVCGTDGVDPAPGFPHLSAIPRVGATRLSHVGAPYLSPLLIDDDQAQANSRLAGLRLATLTLRWMEYWRRNVGDYDSAMILLAVVAITAGRLLRSDLPVELRDMGKPLPEGYLARCNISSIAAATGLNRETTRRKVKELIELGYLVRLKDQSIRFRPGYLQRPQVKELVRKQLDSFTRVANELARDGVYRA